MSLPRAATLAALGACISFHAAPGQEIRRHPAVDLCRAGVPCGQKLKSDRVELAVETLDERERIDS